MEDKNWDDGNITQYLKDFSDGGIGIKQDEINFLRLACILNYFRTNYPDINVTVVDIHLKSVNINIEIDPIEYETIHARMSYDDSTIIFHSRLMRKKRKTFKEFIEYLEKCIESKCIF